ncbi:hypothetical protein [Glycomyces sp. NPDC047010]|uniref:hypothetical protein n=1 Tax=Glycomyces sp. NPDC047010 TaxID=3155023 RepID=UPI0033F8245A
MNEFDELGMTELANRLKLESPEKMSIAGAFAFGYGALGMQQTDAREDLSWYNDLGPLETLFLGMIFPKRFADVHELSNSLATWLRQVRGEKIHTWICEFVTLVVDQSFDAGVPVDDGDFLLSLNHFLEKQGFHRYRIPGRLLPGRVLQGSRVATGFADVDLGEITVGPTSESWLRWFWEEAEEPRDNPTVLEALRNGLRRLRGDEPEMHDAEPDIIVLGLYLSLVADSDETISDLPGRAFAWSAGLREDSPICRIVDIAYAATRQGWTLDDALLAAKEAPGANSVVETADRRWMSSPLIIFREMAVELGHGGIIARHEPEWASASGGARAKTSAMELLEEIESDLRHADLVVERSNAPELNQRRINYDGSTMVSLSPQAAAKVRPIIEEQRRMFEATFGRSPGPGDPVFWDPDRSDEPTPIDPKVFQSEFHQGLRDFAMRSEDPTERAMFLACADVGMLIAEENLHTLTTAELAEYDRRFAHHLTEEQSRVLLLDPADEIRLRGVSEDNIERKQMRKVIEAVKRRASEFDRDRVAVLAALQATALAAIARELPQFQRRWGDGTPDETLRSFVDEAVIDLRDPSILALTVDEVVAFGSRQPAGPVDEEVLVDWMQVLNEVVGFDEDR